MDRGVFLRKKSSAINKNLIGLIYAMFMIAISKRYQSE